MQIPLEISTRDVTLSPPIEAELRKRADKLERHYNRITSCRVALERPTGNHHHDGGPYRVRVDVTLPGSELVADKQADEIFAALRDAFDAAERQVDAFVERRRGTVKSSAPPPEGEVVRLFSDEGFGFLTAADGREVYFHRNAVLDPGFDKLTIGSRVRFAEEQGFEGPQASTVSLVETGNGGAAPAAE
ncbi:MAG TPA: HPF/RaiA family ribosome-associated protein [Thermoanaerobaculia bacterium]|jgi:ribosomal subunit interface protein|nr:HPF/RaiA family ribosome-associated protein [Thermoanaerobaculia bacterium]